MRRTAHGSQHRSGSRTRSDPSDIPLLDSTQPRVSLAKAVVRPPCRSPTPGAARRDMRYGMNAGHDTNAGYGAMCGHGAR